MTHLTHRHWFLTWRTYGSWLPGDDRGFVGPALNRTDARTLANDPGSPPHPTSPPLRDHARAVMKAEPVRLGAAQAADVFAQLRETATYRGWELLAVSVTTTHVHVVVRVEGDPDGGDILGDFKSYAGRRLNREWGRPPNGSWWSESGSRRVLKDDGNVTQAVRYVAEQSGAFLVWYQPVGERPA